MKFFRDATGVELHKESKWYAGWKNFSENNAYYNSMFHVFVLHEIDVF